MLCCWICRRAADAFAFVNLVPYNQVYEESLKGLLTPIRGAVVPIDAMRRD
jgi:hypothetical protein